MSLLQNFDIVIKKLDGLPFPPDHFDFIRIVGMGFAIAEDEWRPVLEVCPPFFFIFLTYCVSRRFTECWNQAVHAVLEVSSELSYLSPWLLISVLDYWREPSSSSQLQKTKSVSPSPSNQSPLIESPVLPQHVKLPRKRSYVFSNKSSERSLVSSIAQVFKVQLDNVKPFAFII